MLRDMVGTVPDRFLDDSRTPESYSLQENVVLFLASEDAYNIFLKQREEVARKREEEKRLAQKREEEAKARADAIIQRKREKALLRLLPLPPSPEKLADLQDAFSRVSCTPPPPPEEAGGLVRGTFQMSDRPPLDVVVKYPGMGYFMSKLSKSLTFWCESIELMASVKHPLFLPLLACNFDPHDRPCFVTPRMKMSLQAVLDRLRKGDIPDFWDDTVKSIILLGVTSALAYLHSRGIVHAALEPSKILLDEHFRPRLRLSGRSRYLNDHIRAALDCFPKPYLAPEARSSHGGDEKIDVFSYGEIVMEIVSSKTRLRPNVDSGKAAVNDEPLVIPYGVNRYHSDLWEKCISLSPDDRPSFRSILERPDLLMLESCDHEAFSRYRNELPPF
jgi:serine/threonine protein kinase